MSRVQGEGAMFYFEVDSVAFFISIECEMTRTKVTNSPKKYNRGKGDQSRG